MAPSCSSTMSASAPCAAPLVPADVVECPGHGKHLCGVHLGCLLVPFAKTGHVKGSNTSWSAARLECLEMSVSDPVSCQMTGKNPGGMKQAWGHDHRLVPKLCKQQSSCYGITVVISFEMTICYGALSSLRWGLSPCDGEPAELASVGSVT